MKFSLFRQVANEVSNGLGVQRTPRQNLKVKEFRDGNKTFVAIEQNPNKPSQWAAAARNGAKVVQFKDKDTNRYVGVSVNGRITPYNNNRTQPIDIREIQAAVNNRR